MEGTKSCLCANIDRISITSKVRQRIISNLMILFLTVPRKCNFSQLAKWGEYNENTYHNWFKQDLDLVSFNYDLIKQHSTGRNFVLFDPSFLNKSGKKTPFIDYRWSGCAGAVKRGLEMCSLAVADMKQHTAYHLSASLTPNSAELKEKKQNLMEHYVKFVLEHKKQIQNFGNMVVSDGYFGVFTFVSPLLKKGLRSLLKTFLVRYLHFNNKPTTFWVCCPNINNTCLFTFQTRQQIRVNNRNFNDTAIDFQSKYCI